MDWRSARGPRLAAAQFVAIDWSAVSARIAPASTIEGFSSRRGSVGRGSGPPPGARPLFFLYCSRRGGVGVATFEFLEFACECCCCLLLLLRVAGILSFGRERSYVHVQQDLREAQGAG